MNSTVITPGLLTFGQYKGIIVEDVCFQDKQYCQWFVYKSDLPLRYPFIANFMKSFLESNPFKIKKERFEAGIEPEIFINRYCYFFLPELKEIPLSSLIIDFKDEEKVCYNFYKKVMNNFKNQIIERVIEPFNVKLPKNWLKNFEDETKLSRDVLKEFLSRRNLPPITLILEEIKLLGGIEYKGNNGFKIATERSKTQEAFWEVLLKKYFKDEITIQHKFENCIFDFLNAKTKVLYECKLGLKDFNEKQYIKYKIALDNSFKIVYLIGEDCIVHVHDKKIFTSNQIKYKIYFATKKKTKLDLIIENFEIIELKNIENYFIEKFFQTSV